MQKIVPFKHLRNLSIFRSSHPEVFFLSVFRSTHPEVFLVKGPLKTCSKFTGEHPCWRSISIRFLKCYFHKVALQTTLQHRCSPVNLLQIFRTLFSKNTSGWLLLCIIKNPMKVNFLRISKLVSWKLF